MNKAQRIVLVVGFIIAVAMIAYPPWIGTAYNKPTITKYRFIASDTDAGTSILTYFYALDPQRLCLQLIGLAFATGAGYFAAGWTRTKEGQ